jgi:hypothetical protein
MRTCLVQLKILAATLPWVVVSMRARWPMHINIVGGKKDPRPSMAFVFMGSRFCLLWSQIQNLEIDTYCRCLSRHARRRRC